jgi:peptidoglycan/LPS O-acetylase OafA/YrhL
VSEQHPQRQDIEGLRGIAILSVVFYHFDERLIPGGLTGVDIFFVISGFLITAILLREYGRTEGIDLAAFWARRARRILPAATLVLVVTSFAAIYLVSPLLLRQTGRDILASAIFGLNWRAAFRAVDYSAPGADASPVLHYWSLGVEEQFYLIWPILLLIVFVMAKRLRFDEIRSAAVVTAVLAIVSFGLCVQLTQANQPMAFFGTASRAWQLLTGAGLAFVLARGLAPRSRIGTVLASIGMAAMFASFFIIDPQSGFPGWIAALPVAGAAAVIYAGSGTGPAGLIARGLTASPLRFIGRVSYVWYLWHWPVLFFGRSVWPNGGHLADAMLLAFSLALAVLTHYFFENPLRYLPLLTRSRALSLLAGAALVSLSALAAVPVSDKARQLKLVLSSGREIPLAEILADRSPAYRTDCHLSQTETVHQPCIFGTPGVRPTIVLLGDSHAAHLFNPVELAARQNGVSFLMRSKSACPAIEATVWNDKYRRPYEECDIWRQDVLKTIRDLRPEVVILSSATFFEIVQGRDRLPVSLHPDLYKSALRSLITAILDHAGRVIVVQDTPELPMEPLECVYRHPRDESKCAWPLPEVSSGERFLPEIDDLRPRAEILDLNPEICRNGNCSAFRGNMAVFYDTSHLTASFSEQLAPLFSQVIAESRTGSYGNR